MTDNGYVNLVTELEQTLRDDEIICAGCLTPRFTFEKCPDCGFYPESEGQEPALPDATVRLSPEPSEEL